MATLDFKQDDRFALLHGELGYRRYFRKGARIIAVRMREPFTVETDRGIIQGYPGDYLVTNDPRDDPESDLWTVSAARMAKTYLEENGTMVPVDERRGRV
jgi:hypothetical protein